MVPSYATPKLNCVEALGLYSVCTAGRVSPSVCGWANAGCRHRFTRIRRVLVAHCSTRILQKQSSDGIVGEFLAKNFVKNQGLLEAPSQFSGLISRLLVYRFRLYSNEVLSLSLFFKPEN
jgi:hypothetical protein